MGFSKVHARRREFFLCVLGWSVCISIGTRTECFKSQGELERDEGTCMLYKQ